MSTDPATTFIIIEEVDSDNWGIAGEVVLVVAGPRSQVARLITRSLERVYCQLK
jgi:phenylpyruvate tautomerase PptA (4-oxalocrotonate tautomerase family)